MVRINIILSAMILSLVLQTNGQGKTYINNRAPLRPNPYIELPLGAIRPEGWLKEMLVSQKNGATGQLDKLYPLVMDQRNGWLGGDGDQWERGPYWIDGLVPLAYILRDTTLIAKARPWIEWAINSQQPDGYFGPSKDYGPEPGLQRDNSHDWWPKIVMLKVLQQYYQATGDKRVIRLMTNYFKYQLKELPARPLDHWSFWARYRAGDNLMVVYWLYNITGDAFLLQLGDLLHRQTFDFTGAFLQGQMLSTMGSIHGVNLAQGMKEPLIYYQQHPERKYLEATAKGFDDLRKFNGFANGMFGGDESLHGNNPTQGAELCTAVEMMFTLEEILGITGAVRYADQLEKIAFNALPSQVSEDFTQRQYFQQANQVMLTRHTRNFDVNHDGTDLCFGLLTGYPCCTSNMHQGWPKFTQHLWYATPDNGLAALVYSPSEVTAYVAGGKEVTIREETGYPFSETIQFRINTAAPVSFPLRLRIPSWCESPSIRINGIPWRHRQRDSIVRIEQVWRRGDVVELSLPMNVFTNTWYENAVSVERGPITYALRVGGQTKHIVNEKDPTAYGSSYEEVTPTTPWNYGLVDVPKKGNGYIVEKKGTVSNRPWSMDDPPVLIRTKARRIPSWQLYNEMAGPTPYSMTYQLPLDTVEEVTLIPYGCTRLRIAQFPLVGGR